MKCDKCSIPVLGGSNPSGFHFPPCTDCFKNNQHILCRDCYKKFWKEFGILRNEFIDKFFKKE